VLRTLKRIVDDSHRVNVPVGVCGEMAGDPNYAALLLGLGIDSLSMAPPSIPAVRFLIRAMTMADARELATQALAMTSSREIFAKCQQFHRSRVKME
jgi:phosphotransferase system enzyme I (PtsI)